ncbi:hypothetical protein FRE64_08060 [Euhalothece natronophila Z-M001]|uniref:Peptidylprolyl isomerase n=1 Tax=Euhalothece natronophila Z-M001 TaxID=522448 RepID=A0A5B8NNY7_9CHRO|nr:hypothetical protein [Euhalothece natronophila]QDZ39899.1 hypothetical protein FRE64_08060 [Euhalothece natronophila Z-M001]
MKIKFYFHQSNFTPVLSIALASLVSVFTLPANANENRVNLLERVAEETGIDVGVDLQDDVIEAVEAKDLENFVDGDVQELLERLGDAGEAADKESKQELIKALVEDSELQQALIEAVEVENDELELDDTFFINVVAAVSQKGTLDAIATQVLLEKPRELLDEVNITFAGESIRDAVDIDDLNETELKIEFETIDGDDPDFEVGDDLSESELISLVRAFTEGIGIQERDRVTATAFREEEANADNTVRSVIATEVELAPGQSFDQNNITTSTKTQEFNGVEVLSELTIESNNSDILTDNENLEVELAQAIEEADFDQASSIISLVRAFGDGGEQEQARVSGASLVDDQREDEDNDLLSVAAGEVELARGQLIGEEGGTLVTVTSELEGSETDPIRVEGLEIEYFIDEDSLSLEEAIATKVQEEDLTISEVISLVKAITQERERSFQDLNEPNVGLE